MALRDANICVRLVPLVLHPRRITTYNVTLDLSFYFRQFSSLVRVSRCTRLPFSSAMGKSGKGGGRTERKVAPTTSAKNNAPVCVSSLLFLALTLQRPLLYLFFLFSPLTLQEREFSFKGINSSAAR